jgi:hypothetical protein
MKVAHALLVLGLLGSVARGDDAKPAVEVKPGGAVKPEAGANGKEPAPAGAPAQRGVDRGRRLQGMSETPSRGRIPVRVADLLLVPPPPDMGIGGTRGGARRKKAVLEGKRMASGHTGNVVPGNRLRVRLPCPPLVPAGTAILAGAGGADF